MSNTSPILTVVRGDITQQADCDVIVNSANQNLRAGSGVCGAIYRTAGPELEPCSMKLAPLPLGDAVVTPGFGLPNQSIIHVRGPKYLFDPDPPAMLAKAMSSVLKVADAKGYWKIAVPAISMGVYAYPSEEAVPILVNTCISLLDTLRTVREIRFVVRTDELASLFSAYMPRHGAFQSA